MIYSGFNTGSVSKSDEPVFGSMGSASTLVENITIISYFEKQSDLIKLKPVNLVCFQCSLFCVRVREGQIEWKGAMRVSREEVFEMKRVRVSDIRISRISSPGPHSSIPFSESVI